ncbi:hypothetical protein MASR2M29_15470 [Spirochaetota bacterium]
MSRSVLLLSGGRSLDYSQEPIVMGILNITPDSFYKGSRYTDLHAALAAAAKMLESGAKILDIGGESSRPGSNYIDEKEELNRILPVIKAIRENWDIAISVDTRKSAVARAALDEGADIINDISALRDDPFMAKLCAEKGAAVVLMHKKGIPLSMQDEPWYEDCITELRDYLLDAANRAVQAGIAREKIILDPGIGFGKRLRDNLSILSRLDEFAAAGYPLMVGLSRKAFIGQVSGAEAESRLPGSLAAICAARQKGAVFFRVHDTAESVQALKVYDKINLANKSQGN